jgi:hypothetical protein
VPEQRDTLVRADVRVAPPFTHPNSWPQRLLVVCAQEVMRRKVSEQERWQADLQVSFRHSRKMNQWALEVNTSVIGHDEQDPTWDWDCTPPMWLFVLSGGLFENGGMAMSS